MSVASQIVIHKNLNRKLSSLSNQLSQRVNRIKALRKKNRKNNSKLIQRMNFAHSKTLNLRQRNGRIGSELWLLALVVFQEGLNISSMISLTWFLTQKKSQNLIESRQKNWSMSYALNFPATTSSSLNNIKSRISSYGWAKVLADQLSNF